jgi:hypothetical protein
MREPVEPAELDPVIGTALLVLATYLLHNLDTRVLLVRNDDDYIIVPRVLL